jgi:hypothetical protein
MSDLTADLQDAVESRKRELLSEEPFNDELSAIGITAEEWETYLRVLAAQEIADNFDAPDPSVRVRYERVNSQELTLDDVEKGKRRAKELGL